MVSKTIGGGSIPSSPAEVMTTQNSADNNDLTIETYRSGFDVYEERTPNQVGSEVAAWIEAFIHELPEHARVLEFGSATGRDARFLRERGITVLCTDVVDEAVARLKADGFEAEYYDFRETPPQSWIGAFDGFYANGVFVHATEADFIKNVQTISTLLKPHGVLAFSLKEGAGEEVSTEKMDMPRYFKYYSEEEVRNILASFPFEFVSLTYTHDKKWMRFILKKQS